MKRGSLQSKIPPAIREQLAEDPYMKDCVLAKYINCAGRIQWHHGFAYAGKRVSDIWAIQPLCEAHHAKESAYRIDIQLALLSRIRHFNALEEFRAKYPRSTLKSQLV